MSATLDLRRLRYFRSICEYRSISAASRALNVAQPALSHHVRQLELAFGTSLLVRRNQGVEPTEAGRALHRAAVDVSERVSQVEAELLLLAQKAPAARKVRLAVIASLAAELTPVLLASAARNLPDVVFHISEAGTRDGRDLLTAGKADLAILLTRSGDEEPIAWELLHLVGAPEADAHLWIPVAEALGRPLIVPARPNPLRELLEQAAGMAGIALDPVLEIDGAAPRLTAVRAGLGNTVLGAHSTVSVERALVSVRPIGEPALRRPVFLASRQGMDRDLLQRVHAVLALAMSNLAGLEVTVPAAEPRNE